MPKFNLIYNHEQWVDMMKALGSMKPPKYCTKGLNIATTVELDGIVEALEPGEWLDIQRGFTGPFGETG